MKILIVRLSALGDIVHALPVLAAIKKAKPDAQVDWLVEENYASILSIASGLRRRVIVRASRSFETPDAVSFGGLLGYRNAATYLWNQDYDVGARSPGPDQVGGVGAHFVREPRDRIRRPQPAGAAGGVSLFGNGDACPGQQASRLAGQQAGRRSRHSEEPFDPLGAADQAGCGRVAARAAGQSRRRLAAIDAAGGRRGYIVLNPGAAWPNKRWPPDRFGALAAALRDRAGLRSLVTWGPSERDLADAIVHASSGAATAAPATSVSDLGVLMREAALVVSGDTGPLHIAAAMGTPLVGLYGPTWPERNGPWDPNDVVISRANVCVCHHKRQCLRGAPCINEITLEEVVSASQKRLAAAGLVARSLGEGR